MGQTDNRLHEWWVDCPYCGKKYHLSNLMIRHIHKSDGKFVRSGSMFDVSPYVIITDVHQIACQKKNHKK